MVSENIKHYPVLLNEVISIITPQHGGTFIDCTFGQGGYTKKILSFKNTQVIALDRDEASKKSAERILKEFGVDSDAPDLFNSETESSISNDFLSSENEEQEDDLEIPAFLRRQKN